MGSKVMVENLESGDKAEVKITDRGPYAERKRRIIDLSKAAADSIGLVEQGVAPVRVTVTEGPSEAKKSSKDEDIFYEVQVGAFEDGKEAHAVLEQLKPRFANAYLVPRDSPAGEYYRVRIGPFKTKEEAQQVADALKPGGRNAFVDEVPESAITEEKASAAHEEKAEKIAKKSAKNPAKRIKAIIMRSSLADSFTAEAVLSDI